MDEKQSKLRQELASNLPHFTGTEEYHRLRYPLAAQGFPADRRRQVPG